LSQLTNLTSLNLQYTQIGDGQLGKLKSLSELNTLSLVGTRVTDSGLAALGNLKSLRKVYLYKTDVSEAGVAALRQRAPVISVDTGGYVLPVRVTDTLVFRYE
jgi:hypothetical protein